MPVIISNFKSKKTINCRLNTLIFINKIIIIINKKQESFFSFVFHHPFVFLFLHDVLLQIVEENLVEIFFRFKDDHEFPAHYFELLV